MGTAWISRYAAQALDDRGTDKENAATHSLTTRGWLSGAG